MTRTASDRLTRVVVADDHESTRFLLRTLLEFVSTIEIVGEASTGRDAVAQVLEHQATSCCSTWLCR